MTVKIITGDCRQVLATLPAKSVNCCVTSPPYFGLRDYGVEGQTGLEATPEAFVAEMVAVFREVWRVLRDDGVLWLNLGDSYNGYMANQRGTGLETKRQQSRKYIEPGAGLRTPTLKNKDLIGIPWKVAFALQADGWWLRQDIIWAKPNPMPESVTDRCTKAHEYIFMLTKSAKYFYDADAVKEDAAYPPNDLRAPKGSVDAWLIDGRPSDNNAGRIRFQVSENRKALRSATERRHMSGIKGGQSLQAEPDGKRNKRSVWTVTPQPLKAAHFATFPPKLIEPCILAGCPEGGMVLDPFGGAGTTGLVAEQHKRNAILIELNPAYVDIALRRIHGDVI